MDAFSYLSVLLSIILGLAITQVLQGVRGLLLARRHVTIYVPTLIWSGLILVMATQFWWTSFGLANHRDWNFAAFGIVLIQTTLLYMLAALVLPDIASGEPCDLVAHYYRERRPFFLIAAAMIVASFLKEVLLEGRPPEAENRVFHAFFIGFAIVQFASARRWLHEVLAIAMTVLMAIYITLLFTRLA